MIKERITYGGDYKCICRACGYSTEKNINDFIELTQYIRHYTSYDDELEETTLYACPKCGTVQIEV